MDFPSYIDSTMRKDLASCDYLFFINWVRRLKPIGINPHLLFGGSMARGLEVYRKAYYGEESLDFRPAFYKGCEALIKEYGRYEIPEDAKPSVKLKTLGNCLIAFDYYLKVFNPVSETLKPLMTPEGPAVEFSFALPIPNTTHPQTGVPILYCGKFDMLAVAVNGALLVVDEKTSGSLTAHWAQQWNIASQFSGYLWACREFGYKVSGAFIRGIQISKTEIKELHPFIQRSNWEIDRWIKQVEKDVKRAIRSWEENYWDMNLDGACQDYGGCSLLEACLKKDPEKIFSEKFEHNSWNPLES